MASKILSSKSYINYLNDYINIILKSTNHYLIENLNKSYLDEIENYIYFILSKWYNEEKIDQQSLIFIENVGYLHHKIGLLIKNYSLNKIQLERIENLIFNSKLIEIIILIIQSIIETDFRHNDKFFHYFSTLLNVYSLFKSSKLIFNQIVEQIIQSKYYKQYLIEILSLNIEEKHLFFIGTISQLAQTNTDLILHKYYSEFLQKFYNKKFFSINSNIHHCTLGILSQLNISYLINDYSCISTLVLIFLNEKTKIFILSILKLFNLLCIQSKTIACYLNTNEFLNNLLQYVTDKKDFQLHLYVCILLGHIINEKQLIKYRISYKLTMKLFDLLNNSKENIYNILSSLLTLVIHEQIQIIIVQTYQLKILIKLSKNFPIIYDIIWKLSFHSDIIEQLIINHKDFLNELSTTILSQNGILENIQMKNLLWLPIKNEISFNINLVYSSKNEIIVQKIKEKLLKNNFQITTSLNSSNILLCINEETKHDCLCQTIIRQALLEHKKIFLCIIEKSYRFDDWFNKFNNQENKIFNIDKFDMEKFSIEIQKDHELQENIETMTLVDRNTENTFILSPPSPPTTTTIPKKKIQNWTNRDVLEWCENNKLTAFTKILTLYDGRNLLSLAQVSRMSAPHTVINQLRNDCRKQGLNLTFVEYVRFQTALDELFRLERNRTKKQTISSLAKQYVYKGKTTTTTMN